MTLARRWHPPSSLAITAAYLAAAMIGSAGATGGELENARTRDPRQRWHFDLWQGSEVAHEQVMTAVARCRSVVGDTSATDGAERELPVGRENGMTRCIHGITAT